MTGMWAALAVTHLVLGATWAGSMGYSLFVVQPKAARFFGDSERLEEFLITLAHGNRWRVVGLIAALVATAGGVVAVAPGNVAGAFAGAIGLYLVAASIFWYVSWRHWPARVFALPDELPGYQRQLRLLARIMLALAGTAFLVTLSASVAAPR